MEFWAGKKVLITGHTGFKGAWLSLWLQNLGADLVGYSLAPPTEPNLFTAAGLESGMVSINGDVRDLSHMEAVFTDHRPEIVIHMAAQSLVLQSYRDPLETYQTNIMGTVHVLEAARRCRSVKALLIVTSDKCYENREWDWPYRENEPLGGRDPYSSSKACAELVTEAYRRSFFIGGNGSCSDPVAATARAGNVIGGGDWAPDRLVPDCVRALIAGRHLELRSPGSVRPWQHVLDPLYGYMTLLKRLSGDDSRAFCGAWNFGPGPGDNDTVGNVAQRIAEKWGKGFIMRSTPRNSPHEAGLLRLDATKAMTRLGWRPLWSLDRALEETAKWYKAWNNGENMRAFSLDQIAGYEDNI